MVRLNLPEFQHTLRKAEGKVWIFDVIRKKYLELTPEEWVRQHFVHYLLNELSCPKSLIRLEGGLLYNTLRKRSDIVVFDRTGKPWMVVECKSPSVTIDESTLRQASLYNATLKAGFITVTNGMKHYCCRVDWRENTVEMLTAVPQYEAAGLST